jgi:hypothetical protein
MKYGMFVITPLFILAASVAAPADPAAVDFPGPSGWSHMATTAAPDPTRTVMQWHIAGDPASVTFIKDASTTYADAVAAIEKNFSTNNIKPATDKDVTCQGKTGHEVDFAVGPDGHQMIIHRMIVPDGAGIATITYARSDGSAFDSDVKKSETAYCAAT